MRVRTSKRRLYRFEPRAQFRRGSYPLLYPIPICLLGAMVDCKPNYEAVGNIGMVSFNPNLLMVSSLRSHHTNRGVNEHGTFSVNYPSAVMVAETDYARA